MQYQDCVEAGQEDADPAAGAARWLADANINPLTGLATDYLNHFNEAIMLLDMLSSCPDCLDDLINWRPLSYREHFMASRFKSRDLAIAAYDGADAQVRERLDTLATTMTMVLEATRATMTAGMPPRAAGDLAERAAAWLKTLVARAGAVINGESDGEAPQAMADGLMQRSASQTRFNGC